MECGGLENEEMTSISEGVNKNLPEGFKHD